MSSSYPTAPSSPSITSGPRSVSAAGLTDGFVVLAVRAIGRDEWEADWHWFPTVMASVETVAWLEADRWTVWVRPCGPIIKELEFP